MDKVDNLAEIKAMALDNRKVSLQHNLNKETAKDRIQSILDEGSFIEISAMYQQNGGGIIGKSDITTKKITTTAITVNIGCFNDVVKRLLYF